MRCVTVPSPSKTHTAYTSPRRFISRHLNGLFHPTNNPDNSELVHRLEGSVWFFGCFFFFSKTVTVFLITYAPVQSLTTRFNPRKSKTFHYLLHLRQNPTHRQSRSKNAWSLVEFILEGDILENVILEIGTLKNEIFRIVSLHDRGAHEIDILENGILEIGIFGNLIVGIVFRLRRRT